jgi:hypothetical protein
VAILWSAEGHILREDSAPPPYLAAERWAAQAADVTALVISNSNLSVHSRLITAASDGDINVNRYSPFS